MTPLRAWLSSFFRPAVRGPVIDAAAESARRTALAQALAMQDRLDHELERRLLTAEVRMLRSSTDRDGSH